MLILVKLQVEDTNSRNTKKVDLDKKKSLHLKIKGKSRVELNFKIKLQNTLIKHLIYKLGFLRTISTTSINP